MDETARILIVDDDHAIRQTLKLILNRVGYQAESAATGQEALAMARASDFNITILDLRLPDMRGVDLVAPLREINPEMIAIISTGHASLDNAIDALHAGVLAYITKPLNMDMVLATIRQGLEKQRLVEEKRLAEQELFESREQFRSLFENVPIGVFRTTPGGRILMANPALIGMLGYSSFEELAGMDLDYWTRQVGLARDDFRARLAQDGEIRGLETVWEKLDGASIILRENVRVVRSGEGLVKFYEGTLEDITERKNAERQREILLEKVQAGRERLRSLANQVVSVQEEERQLISRELHDETGQTLTYLTISLDTIRLEIPQENDVLKQKIGEASELVQTIIKQIHRLTAGLRPPALDTLGLNRTLAGYCREFMHRTHIKTGYEGLEIPALPDFAGITLYRLLQEALTNVAKHANARQVNVELGNDDRKIWLSVIDDGDGFETAEDFLSRQTTGGPQKLGLLGMRERFILLGGYVEIVSQPGSGTQVTGLLPLMGKHLERRDINDQSDHRR